MSAVVVYLGHAAAVEGAGYVFPRGKPVEVPNEVAESLGSAFKVQKKRGDD